MGIKRIGNSPRQMRLKPHLVIKRVENGESAGISVPQTEPIVPGSAAIRPPAPDRNEVTSSSLLGEPAVAISFPIPSPWPRLTWERFRAIDIKRQ
jgi:hypothetical protein